MKKTTAAVLAILCCAVVAQANVLTFHGIITANNGLANPLMKVGDDVSFVIHHNAAPGNAIIRMSVLVNGSLLNLIRTGDGSHVYIDENTADGTVQWAVLDGASFNVDVATNTPGGVIPCIDNFDLGRTFGIFFDNIYVVGIIDAKPHERTGN